MNILDLFSGIGGMSLGLHRASAEFETIAFCEIDKMCQEVLKKNFSNIPIFDDVTKLSKKDFNTQIDIITGGFPCQDLSIAGKKLGLLDGARSSLFFQMLRLADELKPKYMLFENVKELLTNAFYHKTFKNELKMLGYDIFPTILRASDFGYPHIRRRAFILAWLLDTNATGKRCSCVREIFIRAALQKCQKRQTKQNIQFITTADIRARCDEFIANFRQTLPSLRKIDGISTKLERIKQYGNTLIPDIPEIFGKVILEIEKLDK